MASLGENLIADILATTEVTDLIGDRAQQNTQNVTDVLPRIWLTRSSVTQEVPMDATVTPRQSFWDVEIYSQGTEENDSGLDDTLTIADILRARWQGKRGTLGTGTVKGMFVQDHDDDYLFQGTGGAEGVHVAALQLEVWHTT